MFYYLHFYSNILKKHIIYLLNYKKIDAKLETNVTSKNLADTQVKSDEVAKKLDDDDDDDANKNEKKPTLPNPNEVIWFYNYKLIYLYLA